jgi:hypothetical protein
MSLRDLLDDIVSLSLFVETRLAVIEAVTKETSPDYQFRRIQPELRESIEKLVEIRIKISSVQDRLQGLVDRYC